MTTETPKKTLWHILTTKFYYVDDSTDNDLPSLLEKISTNAVFSFSFISLLGASTIICTLGLLLSSPPIVIGGMIISPLMWPLLKIAFGFSYGKKNFVKEALILLVLAIAISLLSSFLITLISPIKIINQEIIARTTPTLLDLIVAVAAGAVAALSIAKKKISDSLAGVAIATSLMPPLCVGGIGLALWDGPIAVGGLLLFFSNIVSILFSAMIVFLMIGIRRKHLTVFSKKGVLALLFILLLTSIPLFYLLQGYTFKASAHRQVRFVLNQELTKISPDIHIDDVKTSFTNNDLVEIELKLLMPRELNIDYEQKEILVNQLEESLHKKVSIRILIQELLALQSDSDKNKSETQKLAKRIVQEELLKLDTNTEINSISYTGSDHALNIDLTLISNGALNLTEQNRETLEEKLSLGLSKKVQLSIKVIPLLTLKSKPDLESESLKKYITNYYNSISTEIEINSITIVKSEDSENVKISVSLVLPKKLNKGVYDQLKKELETLTGKNLVVSTSTIIKSTYSN